MKHDKLKRKLLKNKCPYSNHFWDKITNLFEQLRKGNIIALHNYQCCQNCGKGKMSEWYNNLLYM